VNQELWNKIAELTNQHGYMSGVDRESDRVKKTGEVYTPTALVIEIMQKMLESDANVFAPGKTVIDPACGDGQFLVPVKWFKVLHHGMTEEAALNDIYGVDIMPDNVEICRKRLGGGHIICDNALDPQTLELKQWLGVSTLESFFE
jgi:hypothetical protein